MKNTVSRDRTITHLIVCMLAGGALAGCGGGTSETSDTKLLAQTGCASTYCYGYNVTSSSSIQFYVKSAPWADIHYTVNGGTQSNVRMSKVNGNNAYTVTGLKSGDVVRYFFTIGNTSGGQTDTGWMQFTMSSATPTPTPTTTPPSGYSFCANEGGSCSFSGTHAVAYGSGSTFTYRFREGSVNCNNTTFGDPVPGAGKKCYYNPTVTTPPAGPTPDYIFCGKDDGMCSFSGTRQIAYGANGGPYAYRNATDRIGCNTTNFGDPAPGAHEYCWVAPLSPTPTPTPTSSGFVVTEAQFNQMFPSRNSFYTYQGLANAANAISGFASTGSDTVKKQEAAAFLANVAHETGGLIYIEEIDKSGNYCDSSQPYGCPAGTYQYYGRGPMQLSWNFNYKAAGDWMGVNLLNSPSLVATDATISWKSAIWYWMTQSGPNTMTAHYAMVNSLGFGQTIRSINGSLECNGNNTAQMQDRVSRYQNFVNILGVTAGGNLTC